MFYGLGFAAAVFVSIRLSIFWLLPLLPSAQFGFLWPAIYSTLGFRACRFCSVFAFCIVRVWRLAAAALLFTSHVCQVQISILLGFPVRILRFRLATRYFFGVSDFPFPTLVRLNLRCLSGIPAWQFGSTASHAPHFWGFKVCHFLCWLFV